MDDILDVLNDQLANYLPISDDLLLLCFKYCRDDKYSLQSSEKKANFIKRFVKMIQNLLNVDDKNELKSFNLFYFRQFLIDSNYWYMKYEKSEELNTVDYKDDTGMNDSSEMNITFDGLNRLVYDKLGVQREFIRSSITNLNKGFGSDWNALTSYNSGTHGLINEKELMREPRQDSIKNGTFAEFEESFFDKIGLLSIHNDTIKYNFAHLYSINAYLEKLLIKAHSLNGAFQEEMRLVFVNNNSNNNSSNNNNDDSKSDEKQKEKEDCDILDVVYHDAPVKLRKRCVVKAESDDSGAKYPNTANICDLIRCAFVFKSVKSLVKGLKIFETKYNKQIVRVKNGYSDFNFKKFGSIDNMPLEYRDIKFNIIYSDKDNKTCLIAEVQFLLDFMSHAKSIGHSLYSIARKIDYIHSVDYVHKLQYNKNNRTQIIRNVITKREYNAFGLEMLHNVKESLYNTETIFTLCKQNYYKGFKLFHSVFIKHLLATAAKRNPRVSSDSTSDNTSDKDKQFYTVSQEEKEKEFSKIIDIGTKYAIPIGHLLARIGKVQQPARPEIYSFFEFFLKYYRNVIKMPINGDNYQENDVRGWTDLFCSC